MGNKYIKAFLKIFLPKKIIDIWDKFKHRKRKGLKIQYIGAESSKIIYDILKKDSSCMIARFGAVELGCVLEYLHLRKRRHNKLYFSENVKYSMRNNAGFFPTDEKNLIKFSDLMISCIPNIDILGSWRQEEIYLKRMIKAKTIFLLHLEPYNHDNPWSRVLQGKKILVVHPFSETIKQQYLKRDKLFVNKNVLPEFELETITAVQSIAGNDCGFKDWFEALEYMKDEISNKEYDIAIIGCGAYGLPLASFVKEQGKKAIHLGGATQLLFGIKGRRWEVEYGEKYLSKFCYEYWVRPNEKETPTNNRNVENGCYW